MTAEAVGVRASGPDDFRAQAQAKLPHFLFEYYDGAAGCERTARRNVEDLQDVELRQRVLADVSAIDLSATILGHKSALPIMLGPVGLAGMAARRGEVQAARAAARAGIPFFLSTTSVCSIGEVAEAAPCWLQLYMVRDRGFAEKMIETAIAAGADVLMLTVDVPVMGRRRRDFRSGLHQQGMSGRARRTAQMLARPRWLLDVGLRGRPHLLGNIAAMLEPSAGLVECMAWTQAGLDASLTWDDLAWLRARWPGRLVVKGILEADDARRTIAAGADAIVVSNHGGRQLDGVSSTVQALPRIAAAIRGEVQLFVDGGIRDGADIFRMLALGADAILIGRPWLYALAAGGEAAIVELIRLFADELQTAMALTGNRCLAEVDERSIRSLSDIA